MKSTPRPPRSSRSPRTSPKLSSSANPRPARTRSNVHSSERSPVRSPGPAPGHGHGHGHDHDHNHDHGLVHSHAPQSLKSLLTVIVLTGTIFFAELIAGLLSGSLALLSDAMHMLSDSTGLIIALLAMLIGRREATSHATFGFRRVEVLAAAINAATVSIISVWIVIEALSRLGGTEEIDTFMMITVAIIGFIANGISALILVKRQNDSLNMRGAYLHVLSDMLGSVAVIIAGFIIYFTGWIAADTIASLVIAALVLPRSLKLLFTSVGVLLERAPGSVDTKAIEKALAELPEVHAVHDLHIWTTDGATLLATAHLVVDANRVGDCTILDRAQAKLEKWNITHSTIQLERPGHDAHEQVC